MTSFTDRFRVDKKIHPSQFGAIYAVEEITSKTMYAAKVITNSAIEEKKRRGVVLVEDPFNELDILKRIEKRPHQNLISSIMVVKTKTSTIAVLPLATGDLFENLSKTLDETKLVCQQLLSGLSYLHDNIGVEHGDLSLENVACFENNLVKIIDYGQAARIGSVRAYSNGRGKVAYSAPELAVGGVVTGACDVFSFGVIMFALVTGQLPFEAGNLSDHWYNNLQMHGLLFDKTGWDHSERLTPEFCELFEGMTKHEVADRWTLQQVSTHKWMSVNSDVVEVLDQRPNKKIKC